MKKSLISLILSALTLVPCLVLPAFAEGATVAQVAKNIASEAQFYCWGADSYASLTDGDETTSFPIGYSGQLVINTETPIAGLYIKFYTESAVWDMTANDEQFNCGENGFLHEYVDVADLAGETTEIKMDFPKGGVIGELEIYTEGTLPDTVQVWEKPCDRADLVLFSSHSDDEQLFFAGVLPYSVASGARTQVVYFCEHSNTPVRPHEQLDGLWAVGVRNYPIIGNFPDLYSESKEQAENVFRDEGYDHDDFIEWQVENIRRFEPQVIVGHDAAGEYGHGTHIINSETLREAIAIAADADQYPYLTASYGAWDTPKVYLHLWAENEIVLDFDTPLDYFGGKTAYQMSCEGYDHHKSQHWTWFTQWLLGPEGARYTKASQIGKYNPCRYGLWRTTVGANTGSDLFENITLYDVQDAENAPATEQTTEETTTVPVRPDETAPSPADNSDGLPVIWISVGAGVIVFVIVMIVNMRGGKSDPPEPTRAEVQADKLKEARQKSREKGTAPSRADLQAQKLREARERAVQTEEDVSPVKKTDGTNPAADPGKISQAKPENTGGKTASPEKSAPSQPNRAVSSASRPTEQRPVSHRAASQAQKLREARERAAANTVSAPETSMPQRQTPVAKPSRTVGDATSAAPKPTATRPVKGVTRPTGGRTIPKTGDDAQIRRTKPTDKTY